MISHFRSQNIIPLNISGVRMIGIMNNVSEYKLSLPLAKNFETSDSRQTPKVSKEVICEFVQRAVSMKIKCQHSYKFRPLGQGIQCRCRISRRVYFLRES